MISSLRAVSPPIRAASMALTALVPLCIIFWGVWKKQKLLLNLGFLLGVASLLTLRFYIQVAPPWVVLGAAGAACFAFGGDVRRFLDSADGRERDGFTAAPLLEPLERRSVAETITSVAALTPAARAAPEKPAFKGGGGEFGGGGASGSF